MSRSALSRSVFWRFAGKFFSILALLTLGAAGLSAAPLAGTPIGNAASATYKDAAAVDRQVTSNVVTTLIQQVYSFTLEANRTATVAPGGQVVFPHTLTNTGNGPDSYVLSTLNPTGFGLTNVKIYADLNRDGLPDNTVDLTGTTLPLGPGAAYHLVVVGNAPGSATGTATIDLRAQATAVQTPQFIINTDTATITANAVIAVTKNISRASGTPPVDAAASVADPLTYTLTYTNTGNTAAKDLIVTDLIPTGMTYVPGSALWSGSGTPLTDAAAGDPLGIDYAFGVSPAAANTAHFKITTINPGVTGTLSFKVTVNVGLVPGVIPNTAQFNYIPDGGVTPTPTTPTNTVPYTLGQSANVAIGLSTSGLNGEQAPTGSGLVGTVANAAPGDTITFINRVYNLGNGTDAFDISIPTNSFPAGTTFVLYKADGNTPLVDTTGNGIPDTGPLVTWPGGVSTVGTYDVVVKAVLPTTGFTTGTSHSVTVQATSTVNTGVFNTTIDTLTTSITLGVDLTNNAVGGPGDGPYDNSVSVTNLTDPGVKTVFTLVATNTNATTPDTYDISYLAGTLPAGWTVIFRDGTAAAPGAVITNTGVVLPGTSKTFIAEVTPPAGTPPGNTDIVFRIVSPTTTAGDDIKDRVTINTVRGLTLVPNNSGQTYPGGSVVYTHTLTNIGNVVEGNGVSSSVALSLVDTLAGQGWTSVVYWDANNDGILDAADPVVTNLTGVTTNSAAGLAVGASVRLFSKVFAPTSAPNLAIDQTTLTAAAGAHTSGGVTSITLTAIDTTTIILGDLAITKTQRLKVNCAGADPVTPYTMTSITTGAVPGSCIQYQITITNTGIAPSTVIKVYDSVPSFTSYSVTPVAAVTGGSIGTVTVTGGNLVFDVGTLAPGASAVCTFTVQINL